MSRLHAVTELGQSLWLNYLRRVPIDSGELRRMLDEGVRGLSLRLENRGPVRDIAFSARELEHAIRFIREAIGVAYFPTDRS